jgi:RES domain-containing protein
VRLERTCYRAHDPRWAFKPLSGEGAAIRGARFNPKGMPALYLALDIMTAVKEANQGFAHKIEPCVLCSYEVACADIVDLRTEEPRTAQAIRLDDMACPWFALLADGKDPQSWEIARRLHRAGMAGGLVPSFAPGATAEDHNLVLWRWSDRPPHQVRVFDPSDRLPKDQLSWR